MTKATNANVTLINKAITDGLAAERASENAIGTMSVALSDIGRTNKALKDSLIEYAKGTSKERAQEIIDNMAREYVNNWNDLVTSAADKDGNKKDQHEAQRKLASIKRMFQRASVIAAFLLSGKTKENKPFATAAKIKAGKVLVTDHEGDNMTYSASELQNRAQRALSTRKKGVKEKAAVAAAGDKAISFPQALAFVTKQLQQVNSDDKVLSPDLLDKARDLYLELIVLFGEEGTSAVYQQDAA